MLKAIIVGGGIGGLSAAIALRRIGCEVHVFERAPQLAEVGAGISLWANAIRALASIGLADRVRAIGQPVAGGLRLPDGRLLSASVMDLRRRYPDFCVVVHRAELQQVLVDALGADRVTLGSPCEGFTQDDGTVTVTLADGRAASADLLVGADGLRSVVRAQLHGDAAPDYAGYTAWRGVASLDPDRLLPGETWGAGIRFGQVPLTRARVYWFAAANAPEGAKSPDGERALILRMFRRWHAPIEELIAGTADDQILRNDIYDRPPLASWGRERVTLVGDAAHPMTPNLGQGACQAIEDAVVLARSLSRAVNVPSALRSYESFRRPRTDAIVRESRQVGRLAQWQHPVAVRLRSLAMRALPSRLQTSRLEPIIGYDAATDPLNR